MDQSEKGYRQMSIEEIGQDPKIAKPESGEQPIEEQSGSDVIDEPLKETISTPEVSEADRIRERLKFLTVEIDELSDKLQDYKYKEGEYLARMREKSDLEKRLGEIERQAS